MARNILEVTDVWQQIATGEATLTINKEGRGALFFNESASEANKLSYRGTAGGQLKQEDGAPTFVRAEFSGQWEILAVGTL